MVNDQVRNVQIHCLSILEEVIRICDLHNIKYFLIGGSALGAFRHKGFIPWDDDIDIGIVREQYDFFLKVCQTELKSEFYLQDSSVQKKCLFPFAKIRMNNTSFVEKGLEHLDMHHGIFLDVFPLDNLANNKIKRFIQVKAINICSLIRLSKIGLIKSSRLKRSIAFLLRHLIPDKFLYSSYNYFLTFEKNTKGTKLVNFLGAYSYAKECVEKDVFGEGEMVQFEHLLCRVPQKIEIYLKTLYGENYLILPPIEDRKTHNAILIDFEKDYFLNKNN